MPRRRLTRASSTGSAADQNASAAPASGRARPPRAGIADRYLTPKEPIPHKVSTTLGLLGFGVVLAVWSLLSYGGVFDEFFLPSPTAVAASGYDLFDHHGFAYDVWASTRRILIGFVLSALIGIPLGIAIGSVRVVQAFFEPVIAFVRYMPASAFIPLLIIWFGLGDSEKVAVIFIGVFFPITLLIADVSANVPRELLHSSYTLGASRPQVFFRVLLPASWPGVLDNLRIGMGWAWTYLIVAELVAAERGIGHVILTASRFADTGQIIAGIIIIGFIGLAFDALFRWLYRVLFPYAERVAR
jgi:NitT/TauT family transport system permease protein